MEITNANLDHYWAEVLDELRDNLTGASFDSLITKLKPLYIDEDMIYLELNTDADIYRSIIETRYVKDIVKAFTKITGNLYDIQILSFEEAGKKSTNTEETGEKKANTNSNLFRSNLKPKYVFESFVRGKSNELAYAAAVAVSEAPGRTTYNPLFLYGGVGLGKTHLMHSIGNYVLDKNPEAKVLYCSTETFVNEMITSIKDKKNQEFRNKYRDIDVLLIDDIQFLSDKEGTQEEFFHTFNTLYDTNKQIVISSDLPPREIKTLEDRLRSRFMWGLIVDVKLPDFETRTAILEKKAELDHILVPKEVTKFIAKNIVSNIRDLEGALNRVKALSKLSNNKEINLEMADKALKDIISEKEKHTVTVEYIQEMVASYYKLSVADIIGKKRTANIVYPRQVAMYLSRKLLDVSMPKLGEFFGGRDHSTILHGCSKIEDELETDVNLRNVIGELEKRIQGN